MLTWLWKRIERTKRPGLLIPEGRNVPLHWDNNTWEEKAKENPLYAVMTSPEMLDAHDQEFADHHLKAFFAKGELVFREHIQPAIDATGFSKADSFLVEYGCGVGRILNAAINAGYRCAGIDISPTMLRHCQRLVPSLQSLHLLNEQGKCDLDDNVASVVFSFAVLQHIPKLSIYLTAIAEMCRLLRAGGVLAINLNTQDFIAGDLDNPGRTENFETYSLHYLSVGTTPYKKRESNFWSGVYIGMDQLRLELKKHSLEIFDIHFHNKERKTKAIWVLAKKVQ